MTTEEKTQKQHIIIESGLNFLDHFKDIDYRHLFVITDENLYTHYKDLIDHFSKDPIVLVPGESSKDMATYELIIEKLLDLGIERNDLIVAVGGGVVGDITGFVASTILRGVKYVTIPTSLLSMVDSSVGGKTAINSGKGKNLIGTFYQPEKVLIDPTFLDTLPYEEYLSGFAEMIKMAALFDHEFFKRLKDIDQVELEDIKKTISLKEKIVREDYLDKDLRHLLNFGHTYGHAIEKKSEYTIPHGIAIAYGMLYEIEVAINLGLTEQSIYQEIFKVLLNKGIIELPLKSKEIYKNHISRDKKIDKNQTTLIYLYEIGQSKLTKISVENL